MFDNKNKAIELRKNGLSYRSIQKELGVPLSTLSLWFAHENWSKTIAQDLRKKNAKAASERLQKFKIARGFALQFAYARAKEEAEKEYKKLKKNPLFLPSLMLYWVGGDQTSKYYLRFQSADHLKIQVFTRLLEECLEVPQEDIRYNLLLSQGQHKAEIEAKWAQDLKIPLFCFTKTVFKRKPRGQIPFPTAVCTATYTSRIHKEKMLVWLRLVSKEFSKADIV